MNASDFTLLFGAASDDERLLNLFRELNTLRRPQRPDASKYKFYDWILIRKLGLEFGFVDEEYQGATERFRWGHGKLLLAQAYFYSGNHEIKQFPGKLPEELNFSDSRSQANEKLSKFEATRHSYVNDTWDLNGYRLTISYKNNDQAINKILCRLLPNPIERTAQVDSPSIERIHEVFGHAAHDRKFRDLWSSFLSDQDYEILEGDTELDLRESFGASLEFVTTRNGALFHSITFHRNRDQESAGWGGSLPSDLDFEDCPRALFSKIPSPPAKQGNSDLTGYAVWHFAKYTLHVLFSNIDNRLIRVKLTAPGVWKCVEDYED
ncbi:hypothetical protein [Pseudomonas putida]